MTPIIYIYVCMSEESMTTVCCSLAQGESIFPLPLAGPR